MREMRVGTRLEKFVMCVCGLRPRRTPPTDRPIPPPFWHATRDGFSNKFWATRYASRVTLSETRNPARREAPDDPLVSRDAGAEREGVCSVGCRGAQGTGREEERGEEGRRRRAEHMNGGSCEDESSGGDRFNCHFDAEQYQSMQRGLQKWERVISPLETPEPKRRRGVGSQTT